MSKSSTGSSAKPLPAKSAWSKGPPQTAPSPRSQSPAPSAPSQSHLTHSRRPSALGQGIPIKDGVSIPRNNVGAAAAKQGSPVTFGSIDDASAPISSSPAAPNPIKESVVKSFGTVPAAPATASSHINGKPSISAPRQAGSSLATPSTSSSPGLSASTSTSATPSTASGHKLEKPDIKKLFQSPSAPASSNTETQSPSPRSTNLPSQQQNTPTSSQPPPFTPSFTPFVPNRQAAPSSGPNHGPSRSPVFQRQMQNGSGGRSQPPNGGPSGLSSPRLGPPHTPQQAAGPQPPAPGPGQVPQPGYWGSYYYPPEYMQYAPQWGYVQPGMPPQSPHPPHMPQPPHMPPQPHMPMSPRNAPQHLPSTPTMSHATPNTSHPPHPPPPLSHPSSSISSVSSPPPTPSSSARLNASSSAFVPRPTSKIILKNPQDGKEVPLESLTKTAAAPANASVPSSGQASPYRGSSPSTPKRASIRMETEEQRKKRLAEEEEAKEKERQRIQAEADKVKKQKEEEERKKQEEKEREEARKAEEEKARLRKEEEERKAKEEAERKQKEEEEQRKREEEEKERLRKEEEERKAKEEAEAKARQEEEERQRKAKEEEEKRAKEEAERKALEEQREAEEKKKQKEAEEAAAKDKAASAAEEGEVADTPAADTPSPDPKKALRIDTATPTSNAADLGKKRPIPGPLDLSAAKTSRVSSLSTARIIEDINTIKYPEGIQSPRPDLNENAQPGHFRYDRDFLLQFMTVCREKPPNLPPLDAIGLEPIDQSNLAMSRGGSGRHRNASGASAPSRQSSMGLGFGPGKGGSSNFAMGNFGAPAKLTSEERFVMANSGNRSASAGAGVGLPFGRGGPTPIQRTASQGQRDRTRSKRGEKRPPAEGGRGGFSHDRQGSFAPNAQVNLEPVAPLQPTANRWDRKIVSAVDQDSPELVDRKVKGLLNKLTMEKFDSISDQIIAWANKSENEKDGRTLIQVIRLVFEKATDEATWSEMYARLCRKMMEHISPKVQDAGITNPEGKPIAGGQLFRKYLLNRCQEDFERGWAAKEATAAAAATKGAEDDAVKESNKGKEGGDEEIALYSDEYYAAQKAKRQGLGLIKFIGELFKLQMLTERIMHECVKKLLGNVENPEEEEIESLCKLLSTVGSLLDTPKARAHMDIYFHRMKELTKSPNVSSRMQFALQDLLELRDRKWVPRNAAAAPTTIAQVHEAAAKEKLAIEKEQLQRQSGMSRTSSNRGRGRGPQEDQSNPDGWAVAGGAPRAPPKAGDLSRFGKIEKPQTMSFGPASVFSKKDAKRGDQSISRSASNSNMFSMLQQAESAAEAKPAEPPQRKRLVLQPRTVPKEEEAPTASRAASDDGSDEDAPDAAPEMSDADANKKIDEDIKELWAVRNLDEAEVYFTALPAKHHHRLIDKLVTKAVESKATDAELVASFFERASSKELTTPEAFQAGFEPIAEFIFDIAVDAPLAPKLFAQMVKGASLSEQARQQIASKAPEDNDKLLALLS